MRRSTVNSMSGNAERASVHHRSSSPLMSLPSIAGLTLGVTWLLNSGAKNENTACSSPAAIASLYAPSIFRLSDMDPSCPAERGPMTATSHGGDDGVLVQEIG